jgi:phytoene dehydrogenase-like protein
VYDAVVVGSGPNGLAAAIVLARAGRSVLVREGAATAGGGARSAALTLPGFVHDVGSAVHPLAVASPFFETLPLHEHGLHWIEPPTELAHPFDDGRAALLERSTEATGRTLGRDAASYRALMDPLVQRWKRVVVDVLAPLHLPRHPFLLARFGLRAIRSAKGLVESRFEEERARALFAGIAAHAVVGLTHAASAAFGLVLAIAGHAGGWPIPRGGSQSVADALISYLRSLGGEVVTGAPVRSIGELPSARMIFLDLTPRQVLQVAGERLPRRYRRALERFRYAPGVFKMDWALEAPIPWRAPECARAATVHVGGGLEEIAAAEDATERGEHAEKPFLILAQPTLFDPTRAPAGRHTAWAYCHVPNGSTVDMTSRIEMQIERFAPGFRDLILARHAMNPRDLERYNPNLIGGDIGGGAHTLGQLFFRPTVRRVPYATPVKGLYICSSSTPPGAGVHGMCGYHAARAALREER